MKDYLFYLIIGIGIVYYFYDANQKTEKAMEKINKGAIVIDVRTPEEYSSGNFQNSINIPLNTIQDNIDKIRSYSEDIVVVCASGNRSGQAQQILSENGIEVTNGGSWLDLE